MKRQGRGGALELPFSELITAHSRAPLATTGGAGSLDPALGEDRRLPGGLRLLPQSRRSARGRGERCTDLCAVDQLGEGQLEERRHVLTFIALG